MADDLNRLQDLSTFAIEPGEHQEMLQPFVDLAQFITESVACEINIIDAYHQWTIARTEEDLKVLPKEQSICQHTILKDEPHEVKDLQKDDRYSERAYVEGNPWYRYYCGVQLQTSDNVNIGSLCVLDTTPKQLSKEQKEQLCHLADTIVDKLTQDRALKQISSKLYDVKDEFHKFSHDMRSPVNGIVGLSGILADEDVRGEISQKLNMIKDCALTITDEMDTVLNMIDEEENNHLLQEPSVLKELPEKIDRLYSPQAESKGITLILDTELSENIGISKHYAIKITQIAGNLVANGLKFTSSGGTVKVLFESEDAQFLKIVVTDNGKGMDPEQVQAFNKQEEVYGTEGTAGEVSFGIGLQHVRNLVDDEYGSVSVESSKGEGTRFVVTLPL